ncbi:hypothetical protein ABPG77_011468 [Micractinium sp. CCAP 211/92]
MLLEKVPWCTHEGGVYTIHVQHSGLRFATGGIDSQVKVWAMAPLLDARKEQAGPLLLATLTDHSSTVNTVRFSKDGRFLASGSDDRMICVFEHKAGPGGSTLGVSSANVENWKTRVVLRGHSNNVVDLGWSPDDRLLASCSLDNTVCIWDPATGQRVRVLDYHTSFVKGLAWDPVGSYLATQSEDKSVVIWRCDDWSVQARVVGPYNRLVTSTFFMRMSWSPDGTYLATGNSYQGSSHAAVVVQRGKWSEPKEHLLISGHQGCVVSTAFNPRLFHLPKKGGAEGEVEPTLSGLFALGSQDRKVSVWTSERHTALMVGKRFFKNQVTDLAWSPDGYTLLAASSDGTVASFQYSPAELGKPHTQEELESLFEELYGTRQAGRAGGRRLFAESADQLALEAAAAATSPRSGAGGLNGGLALLPAGTPPRGALGGAAVQQAVQQQQQQAAAQRALQPSAKQNLDALDARLSGRLGGGAGQVQLGFDAPVAGEDAHPAAAGRKRVAPEPVGQLPARPASAELMPPPAPRPSGGQQDGKRQRLEPSPVEPGGLATTAGRSACGTAGQPPGGASTGAGGLALAARPHIVLRRAEVPAEVVANLGAPLLLFEDPAAPAAADARRRTLRVTNRERAGAAAAGRAGSRVQADVECLEGGAALWTDRLQGAAVAACGTHNFAAVALADGQLVLYSRAGRHLAAPLKLGAGIAKLSCDAAWRLLALTSSGNVRLFDVEALRSLLNVSLAPLLEEEGVTVLDARLSRQGVPLITLTNSRAYVWSAELDGWACVADESFAASQFVPFMSLPGQGEIATLQAEALRAAIPRPGLPGLQLRLGVLQQAVASRAHLEASLCTALALQSPQEYRRWLLAYARFLAEQGDAGRLAEVCASLLGDASGGGGSGGRGDTDMAEAAGASGGDGGELVAWQPAILGLPKRELLREVLKEMSRNRSLQRTTQTYLDALGELEKAVERQRQAAAAAAATAAAAEAAAAAGSGGGAAILQPAAPSQQQFDAMPATRDPRIS